jgi:hypothetical protein
MMYGTHNVKIMMFCLAVDAYISVVKDIEFKHNINNVYCIYILFKEKKMSLNIV